MTAALFEPITLRGLAVRNRSWVPPMCMFSVEHRDGVPTDWHLIHYGSLARGGAGAVIVEATAVTAEGRISPWDLGLWNDEQGAAFRRTVDGIHTGGAAAGIQIAHAGRKASTPRDWDPVRSGSTSRADGGWNTVAPSAVPFGDLKAPDALTTAGIRGVIRDFAAAATRAVAAGFDFVEIHAAHGYLIHQFLAPTSNHRDDGYGGDVHNRARLLLEIVDAVRAAVPDHTPVLVRLSATDWADDAGGSTIGETVEIVRLLREHGIDLVDVSTGGSVPSPTIPVGPGYQTPFATVIRNATAMPVGAVGLIDHPKQAEHILTTGQADVVLVGRQSLRDPNFPLRAAQELRIREPDVPVQYRAAWR